MVRNPIKVFARLKREENGKKTVNYRVLRRDGREDISFLTAAEQKKHRFYRFCRVFDREASQADVFDAIAKPIINSVINGYNGTIFAYGQTGSGKTYSITGSQTEYDKRGILPRTIEEIFELTKTTPNSYNIYVSYLEIYNEIGYDLLNRKSQSSRLEDLPRVVLLEDAHGEAHLRNLSVLPIFNEHEAMRLVFLGETNRTIADTPMNEYSSRSHCIFTIYVSSRYGDGGKLRRSKLHLVDLAGSERISKTSISGMTLREARNINLSLHYLEQVILALSQQGRNHIPYRNSMMTYILRDSLSGNSLTSMLATLAITPENQPETFTTCRFAQRVSCISTDAVINEEIDPQKEIEFLMAEIDDLKRQLEVAKDENANKDLTAQEKENCRKIVENFVNGIGEGWFEKLRNSELKYCLYLMKSDVRNEKTDENVAETVRIKYEKKIHEKDQEISILTQLLQQNITSSNHTDLLEKKRNLHDKMKSNDKELFTLSTILTPNQSETPSSPLIDATKGTMEHIHQIKENLSKKSILTENVSATIKRCETNIVDIKNKLSQEKIGSEMSETLHGYLISQRKIYEESLQQLDQLKSETDFLTESLKQAENKATRKLRNRSEVNVDYLKKALDDVRPTSSKSFQTELFSNGICIPNLNLEQIGEDFIMGIASPIENDEFTPKSSGAKLLTQRQLSSARSQAETPKEKNRDLFKPSDSPKFIEFMKTVPLTGDFEVDDEIYNFYRSKFAL